ncbi:MAG: hypothetical protein Q4C75_00280 [Bergeyella zoohelcum]|nr:hypothetical protein [Bergeyella zoohelcum]
MEEQSSIFFVHKSAFYNLLIFNTKHCPQNRCPPLPKRVLTRFKRDGTKKNRDGTRLQTSRQGIYFNPFCNKKFSTIESIVLLYQTFMSCLPSKRNTLIKKSLGALR